MRTLVISDLHLGIRSGADALRLPLVRDRLLGALEDVDRLVLLGDVLELMTRHRSRSMALAEPVLRSIGRTLGSHREVIVVPGNHDAPLVRRWALAQGSELTPSTDVPPAASPVLAQLLGWLAPARTRASYPGVWLGPGVWATHGHYLDQHLIPESAVGIRPRGHRVAASTRLLPIDYEQRRGRSRRRRRDSTIPRPAGALVEAVAGTARSVVPRVPHLLLHSGLAPVTATLLDTQMRHASLPAMDGVVRRLGIETDWVIFGHVHRRGPLGGEHWQAGTGTRYLNTGSWLYEPLLVDRASPPHGYWPGGAVLLHEGREPQSVGLLDDVDAGRLAVPRAERITSAGDGGSAATGR
ncbi:MAG TPA: metallophosphoesterase [Solirubrobacteraceae bacterium]|nr:metallophosphoesterase [Solirubrobacteraceae bacterium]